MIKFLRKNFFNKRFIRFGIVGVSGVFINMGILALLTESFHFDYRISSLIAIELSIISNFVLNDIWTWHDREKHVFLKRFLRYQVTAGLTALIFNWGLLVFLTMAFHMRQHYLIINMFGIGLGMIFNFLVNNHWTFKNLKKSNK